VHRDYAVFAVRADCDLKAEEAAARLGGTPSGCLRAYKWFRQVVEGRIIYKGELELLARAAETTREVRRALRGREDPLWRRAYLHRYAEAVHGLVASMAPAGVSIFYFRGWRRTEVVEVVSGASSVVAVVRARGEMWQVDGDAIKSVAKLTGGRESGVPGKRCAWCGTVRGARGACPDRARHRRAVREWLDRVVHELNSCSRADVVRLMNRRAE
jgi:hypothetical protein